MNVDDLVDDAIPVSGVEPGPSDTTPSGESDAGQSGVTAGTGLGEEEPVPSAPEKQKSSSRRTKRDRRSERDAGVPQSAPSHRSRGSFCPRWMHHRKGVYCKACGTVPS